MNIKQLLMGSLALAAIGGASSVGLYYQSLTMERKEKKRKADEYYENAFYEIDRYKDDTFDPNGKRVQSLCTAKGLVELKKLAPSDEEALKDAGSRNEYFYKQGWIKDVDACKKYERQSKEYSEKRLVIVKKALKWHYNLSDAGRKKSAKMHNESGNSFPAYFKKKIKKIRQRMKEDGYHIAEIIQIRDRAKKRVQDDQ